MARRRIALLFSMGAVVMGLTACGSGSPAYRASADVSINRAAFQGTGIKPGMELGWNNRLYQLVTTVPSSQVGQRLGAVSYHGNIGMFFGYPDFVIDRSVLGTFFMRRQIRIM